MNLIDRDKLYYYEKIEDIINEQVVYELNDTYVYAD